MLASGALEGNTRQFVNQIMALALPLRLAVAGTLAILKLVDAVFSMRVPENHEIQGLDITQHGEEGYDWERPVPVAAAAFSS